MVLASPLRVGLLNKKRCKLGTKDHCMYSFGPRPYIFNPCCKQEAGVSLLIGRNPDNNKHPQFLNSNRMETATWSLQHFLSFTEMLILLFWGSILSCTREAALLKCVTWLLFNKVACKAYYLLTEFLSVNLLKDLLWESLSTQTVYTTQTQETHISVIGMIRHSGDRKKLTRRKW